MSVPDFTESERPATGAERIAALDLVRGVAVLGIVIANIIGFGQPPLAYNWPGAFLSGAGPMSEELWAAQLVLVDGKFRGLFTLLFGAGLVLFHRRAEARGEGLPLLARRLGWLGLFGFLHWLLLWRGDILMSYAFAGLVVMWFAGWEWHKQLTLGVIAFALGAIASFASSIPIADAARGSWPDGSVQAALRSSLHEVMAADLADNAREAGLTSTGDYAGKVVHALHSHLADLPDELMFALLETGPLMLIGMALFGAGVFDGALGHRKMRRWGWGLWLSGTLAALAVALSTLRQGLDYWTTFAALNGWMPVPQGLAAVGLLVLLAHWGSRAKGPLAKLLAQAGRCAFTNYIGTSVVALFVFSGLGLGLFGKLDRLELYGVVMLFWLLMLAWPPLWLARYRHGPLEWAWRCLTYGRMLPLLR